VVQAGPGAIHLAGRTAARSVFADAQGVGGGIRGEEAAMKSKIVEGLKEAVANAKGHPAEGTRETWWDMHLCKWRSRTFMNGEWVEK
jgi:hypothetical protein